MRHCTVNVVHIKSGELEHERGWYYRVIGADRDVNGLYSAGKRPFGSVGAAKRAAKVFLSELGYSIESLVVEPLG